MGYEKIPFELRALPNWVVWRYESRSATAGELTTKIPYNCNTGYPASTTDPTTWTTFAHAVACLQTGFGLGFVFSENDPYCGIDLDKIMSQSADVQRGMQNVYQTMNSYSEWSPSNTGIHTIIKARIPNGRNNRAKGTEIYSSGRFFTMTGNPCLDTVIIDRQDEAMQLWAQLGGAEPITFAHIQEFARPAEHSDAVIYDRAASADNGAKFIRLWNGDWKSDYGNKSQSEADAALVNILQFYTKDVEQITRLFMLSGLGQRDKAKRPDYVGKMVLKSFDRELRVVNIDYGPSSSFVAGNFGPSSISAVERLREASRVSTPMMPLESALPVGGPFQRPPPGLMGDIAKFIYDAAPRPIAEMAIAGAMVFMAGICGKAYNISSTGLNQYILMLAPTASGKESIASGISKLMQTITLEMPAAAGFQGPSDLASGQGLIKYLANSLTKSVFSIIPEFGIRMQSMASDRASPSERELQRQLLNLYTKSGASDVYQGSAYSNKEDSIKAFTAPAYSLLGEGVPTSFYSSLDERTVLSGLLPRFTFIEYNGPRVSENRSHASAIPNRTLIQGIKNVCDMALARIKHSEIQAVVLDDIATRLDLEFNEFCDLRINGSSREVVKGLWSRARLKVLKLAASVAVGVDFQNPMIDEECYLWARHLIEWETDSFVKKFESGTLVRDITDLENEQLAAMVRLLRKLFNDDFQCGAFARTDSYLHNQGIILISDISQKLSNTAVFKKDRFVDHGKKINRAFETLKSMAILAEVNWNNVPGYTAHRARALQLIDYDLMEKFLRNN